MLELAPGVYSGTRLNSSVRDRIWAVLSDWFGQELEASVVMLWEDPHMPGGQTVRTLGLPPVEVIAIDGLLVSRRE